MGEEDRGSQLLMTMLDAASELSRLGVGSSLPTNLTPVALAKHILRGRRLRERYFDPELFRDPAWDILLNLFVSEAEGQRATMTSVAAASAVPDATAYRWILTLERTGLLERENHPSDGRVVHVRLSQDASDRLSKMLRHSLEQPGTSA